MDHTRRFQAGNVQRTHGLLKVLDYKRHFQAIHVQNSHDDLSIGQGNV